MDIFTLFGDVGLNIDKASKNLDKIINQAREAGGAFDQINRATDRVRKAFQRNFSTPNRVITQLRQRTEEATEAMEAFKESADLSEVFRNFERLRDALKSLDDELVNLDIKINADNIDVDAIRQKINDALSGLEDRMVDIGVNVNANQEAIDNLKAQLANLQDVMVNVGVNVPDDVLSDLQQQLAQLGNAVVDVEVGNADLTNLQQQLDQLKNVTLNVDVNDADLAPLRAQLDAIGDINIGVNTQNIDLSALRQELDAIGDINVGVNVDPTAVRNLEQQLANLRDLAIDVSVGNVDVSQIQAQLNSIQNVLVDVTPMLDPNAVSSIQAQLDAIQGTTVTVQVDGDTSALEAQLQALSTSLPLNPNINIGGLGNLGQSLQDLNQTMQSLNQQMTQMNANMSQTSASMGHVIPIIGNFGGGIGNLGNGISNLNANLNRLTDGLLDSENRFGRFLNSISFDDANRRFMQMTNDFTSAFRALERDGIIPTKTALKRLDAAMYNLSSVTMKDLKYQYEQMEKYQGETFRRLSELSRSIDDNRQRYADLGLELSRLRNNGFRDEARNLIETMRELKRTTIDQDNAFRLLQQTSINAGLAMDSYSIELSRTRDVFDTFARNAGAQYQRIFGMDTFYRPWQSNWDAFRGSLTQFFNADLAHMANSAYRTMDDTSKRIAGATGSVAEQRMAVTRLQTAYMTLGQTINTMVTPAILGASAAIGMLMSTSESAYGMFRAQTLQSKEETEGFKQTINDLWADFGVGQEIIARVMAFVNNSIGGTDEEVAKMTETVLAFGDAWNFKRIQQYTQMAGALSQVVNELGVSHEEAADMLAYAMKRNNGSIDESTKSILENGEAYKRYISSTGHGFEAFSIMLESMNDGPINSLIESLYRMGVILIELFDKLEPTLWVIANAIESMTNGILDFIRNNPDMATFVAHVLAGGSALTVLVGVLATVVNLGMMAKNALQALAISLGLASTGTAVLNPATATLVTTMTSFKNAILGLPSMLGATFKALLTGLRALPMALGSMVVQFVKMNPLFSAFAGIALIAIQNWDRVAPVLTKIWDNIKLALQPVMDLFNHLIGVIFPAMNTAGGSLSQTLGTILVDALKAIEVITRAVAQVMNGDIKGAFSTLNTQVVTFGGVLGTLVTLWGTYKAVMTAVGVAKTAWLAIQSGATVAMGLWSTTTTIATGVTTAFGAVMAVLTSPITLVIAAIAALVAGVVLLVKNWDTVSALAKGWGKALWDGIVNGLEGLADWLANFWKGIIQFFKDLFGINSPSKLFTDFGRWLLEGLINGIKSMIEGLNALFTSIWDGIKSLMETAWEGYKTYVTTVLGAIKTVIETVWDGIKKFFSTVFGAIKSALEKAWDAYKKYITTVLEGIKKVVETIWNGIKDFFSKTFDAIKSLLEKAWDAYKKYITTVLNGIKDVVETIWNGIKSFLSTVTSAIKTALETAWNAIKSFFSNTLSSIKSTFESIWNAIKSFFSSTMNSIKSTAESVWNAIKSFLSNTLNSIKSTFSSIWNSIKSTVTTIVNAIKSAITTAWNAIKSVTSSVFNAIKSTASSVWNSIKSTVTSVVDGIKNSVSSAFNSIKNTVSSVWNSIKSTISNAITGAWDVVRSMVSKIKGAFNFEWKLPKFKLPHISVNMKKNSWGIPYPDFDVSWYAKGGVFDGASVIGVGEAGKEAVIPLEGRNMAPFAQAIGEQLAMWLGGAQPAYAGSDQGYVNFEKMFDGATFHVRSKEDAREIAKQIHDLSKNRYRGQGLRK